MSTNPTDYRGNTTCLTYATTLTPEELKARRGLT